MDRRARADRRRLFRQLRDQRKNDQKEASFWEKERLKWRQWEEKKERAAQAVIDHERIVEECARAEFEQQLDKVVFPLLITINASFSLFST